MSKMSESEKKWACEYCTYENYPSAIKCTMCRGARPFENIYQLHGKFLLNIMIIICYSVVLL